MLLFTSIIGLLVMSVSLEVTEAVAKPIARPFFNQFNRNILSQLRADDDSPKNSFELFGGWAKPQMPINTTLFGTGPMQNLANNVLQKEDQLDTGSEKMGYTLMYKDDKHSRCETCGPTGKIDGQMFVKDQGKAAKMIVYHAEPVEGSLTDLNPTQLTNSPVNNGGQPVPNQMPYNQMMNNMPSYPSQMSQPLLTAPLTPSLQQMSQQMVMPPQYQNMFMGMPEQPKSTQSSSTPYMYPSPVPFLVNGALGQTAQASETSDRAGMIAQRARLIEAVDGKQQTDATLDAVRTISLLMASQTNQPEISQKWLANSQSPSKTLVPMMLMLSPTMAQQQPTITPASSQLSDNTDAVSQSKEQAVELKTADAARTEGMNEMVQKLADQIMQAVQMPSDVVKDTTDAPSSR